MVHSVEQGFAVNAHPTEQSHNLFIYAQQVSSGYLVQIVEEAYRFMMSNTVSDPVHCIQFVEDVLVVILECRSGFRLVRESLQELPSGGKVLWNFGLSKIPPG